MLGYDIGIKPSIVLIEKWIAINENQMNDNDCHVVNLKVVSETNKSANPKDAINESLDHIHENTESSNEKNNLIVNGSAADASSSGNVDNAISEVQQLIDDPESVATLLLEINRISKSEKKSMKKKKKKEKREKKSRRDTFADLSTSLTHASNYSRSDHQPSDVPYTVAVQNEIVRHVESNQSLLKFTQTSHKIDGRHKRDESSAAASPTNIFELGHDLYEEMVNENTSPMDCSDNAKDDCERPVDGPEVAHNVEVNIHPYNCHNDTSFEQDFNGTYPDTHSSHLDVPDHMDQTQYRSDCGELGQNELEDEPQNGSSGIQYNDEKEEEVDFNQPVDYSIRCRFYESIDSALELSTNFEQNDSPAATLRSGLAVNWHPSGERNLQFPQRYRFDEHRTPYQSDLHVPIPENPRNTFNRPPEMPSETEDSPVEPQDLSASKSVPEHTSGTFLETVEVCCQTDKEDAVTTTSGNKCCKILMESNSLHLTAMMHFLHTINQQVFNFIAPLIAPIPVTPTTTDNQCRNHNSTFRNENIPNNQHENASNREVIPDAMNALVKHNPREKRKKKNSKGIPQKRSKRLLEMTVRKGKESETQNEGETKVLTPFLVEEPKGDDSGKGFSVESFDDPPYQASDDDWLDAVPRKMSFESRFQIYFEDAGNPKGIEYAATPKRLSKYIHRKRIFIQNCDSSQKSK